MTSSLVLSVVTFVYGFAVVLYISFWAFKKEIAGKAGTWVLLVGCAGNIAGFILRWVESYMHNIGHAPLSNLYESLVFFSCALTIIYLFFEYKYDKKIIGVFISPIIFMSIAYASLSPNIDDRIQPLIPALKSNWLIAHVITCFLGYAGFAIAFGISIIYIFQYNKQEPDNNSLAFLPNTYLLDEMTHQMVMFGFLFLTIGIITGAVWANSAWGTYWSWDPKETWSLVTWFVYALFLHARFMRGWQGEKIAYLSIIGFIAVLFTYFGVNFLPGLHSYAQ